MKLALPKELNLDVLKIFHIHHLKRIYIGFNDNDFFGEVEDFPFVGVLIFGEFDFAIQKIKHFQGFRRFRVLLLLAYRHFNYK